VPEELEAPRRVGAEEAAERVRVDALELPREERLLERAEPLELAQELDGLGERQAARPPQLLAVAALQLLEPLDVAQVLQELLEGAAGRVAREGIVAERIDRLGEAVREVVELCALRPDALVVARLIERLALLLEEVVEPFAHLGEGVAEMDVLQALAHRGA